MQRFRGGLVFKAHRLCVSLNSRLECNKEEGEGLGSVLGSAGGSREPPLPLHQPPQRERTASFNPLDFYWRIPGFGDLWYKSGELKRRFAPALRAGGC